MQSAGPSDWCANGSPVEEVTLPSAGEVVVQVTRITGRRKIQNIRSRNRVDRLSDDSILERRFGKIGQVVNDDVTTCGLKSEDVRRHGGLASISGGKKQRCVRREVMHDLHHCCSLTSARGRGCPTRVYSGRSDRYRTEVIQSLRRC